MGKIVFPGDLYEAPNKHWKHLNWIRNGAGAYKEAGGRMHTISRKFHQPEAKMAGEEGEDVQAPQRMPDTITILQTEPLTFLVCGFHPH